jgi:ABC-type cobalamin/Fe3+-siderophores transport system ATPase subunit
MVSLSDFGIEEYGRGSETATILVGPNGSGKSTLLLNIAQHYKLQRNVTIVCNTPHDRFARLRRVKRISVGRTDQSPKIVVKRAVVAALESGSQFYQISSILKHCGYRSRFGFRIDKSIRYGVSYGALIEAEGLEAADELSDRLGVPENDKDLERALAFLRRHSPEEPIWIDATGSVLEFSLAREFASVLAREPSLRRWRIIKGVSVYLERDEDGHKIEMHHASSGQLALISSLLFMITNVGDNPIIIIDEPENSLHPTWQREYVEKVLAAMHYRRATLIVATHAPLVVTGALAGWALLTRSALSFAPWWTSGKSFSF